MIKLKNAEQMAGIKKSCELLSDLFEALAPMVKPGVTALASIATPGPSSKRPEEYPPSATTRAIPRASVSQGMRW